MFNVALAIFAALLADAQAIAALSLGESTQLPSSVPLTIHGVHYDVDFRVTRSKDTTHVPDAPTIDAPTVAQLVHDAVKTEVATPETLAIIKAALAPAPAPAPAF